MRENAKTVAERNHNKFIPETSGILVDNERHVIAMVGGLNYKAGDNNLAFKARRQGGSVFKGFTMSAYFEQSADHSPDDEFMNVPTTYREFKKEWTPGNYRNESADEPWFSVKNAYAHSLNVPTVRVMCGLNKTVEVTGPVPYEYCRVNGLVDQTMDVAEKAGIEWTKQERAERNPSIALGSNGISPMQLLIGYMAIMHDGWYVEPTVIMKIEGENAPALPEPKRHSVVKASTVAKMQILGGAVFEGGTASKANGLLPEQAFGKTGTTDRSTNTWFVGGTQSLWGVVWVGYKSQNESVGRNETGAKTSLPPWVYMMSKGYHKESIMRTIRPAKQPQVEPVEEPDPAPVAGEESASNDNTQPAAVEQVGLPANTETTGGVAVPNVVVPGQPEPTAPVNTDDIPMDN
jgi:penicillin-binding protein 1A